MSRRTTVWAIVLSIFACCLPARGGKPLGKYGVDPDLLVNGEYRGRFAPDADYVLDGKLARDLGPLPPVPFSVT